MFGMATRLENPEKSANLTLARKKVREITKSPGKKSGEILICLWYATTVAIVLMNKHNLSTVK